MPEEIKKLEEQIKKHQEALAENVATLQKETGEKFEQLDADSKEKHEKIVADMQKNIEAVQELGTKLEAADKARKDLEVILAKRAESGTERKDVVGDPELKSAFRKALYSHGNIEQSTENVEQTYFELAKQFLPHLSEEDAQKHIKAMMVGSDPDGGYLCPVEVSTRIIQRLFETSPMRSIANVVTTLRQAYKIPLDDGDLDAGWVVGEIEDRSETSTPEVGEIEIPAHELYAYPSLTLKVLEDATADLDAWIGRKVGSKFGRVQNKAFIEGNGVGRPKGFLDYDEWSGDDYERNALKHIETAGASISADDLLDLQSHLNEGYMPNANWVMARKMFVQLCKLKEGTTGAYLINPRILFEGYKVGLLGSGVTFMDDMPTTQTSGAKAVGYGDFNEGYQIVDRLGISLIRDNLTKKGWLKLFFRMRVGGAVANYDAIKILKVQ